MKTGDLRFNLPEAYAAAPVPGPNFGGPYFVDVQAENVEYHDVPSTPPSVANLSPGDMIGTAYIYGGPDASTLALPHDSDKAVFRWNREVSRVGGVVIRPLVESRFSFSRNFHPVSLKDWVVAASVSDGENKLVLHNEFRAFAAALALRTMLAPFDGRMAFCISPNASSNTHATAASLLEGFMDGSGTKIRSDTRLFSVKAALDAKLGDISFVETGVRYSPPTIRSQLMWAYEKLGTAH